MKSMAFGIYDYRIMCRIVACCCILLKKFKIELNISLKGIILGSQNANRLSLEKSSIALNICVKDICHCVNSKIIVKQENRSLFTSREAARSCRTVGRKKKKLVMVFWFFESLQPLSFDKFWYFLNILIKRIKIFMNNIILIKNIP